jgi:hypothetical protein
MWNNAKFIAARRIWTEPRSSLPASHLCTACARVQLYRHDPQRLPMPAHQPAARSAEVGRARADAVLPQRRHDRITERDAARRADPL